MKDHIGNYCVIDDRVEKTDTLKEIPLPLLSVCYEVIRMEDGVFLFLEDHLRRLCDSCKSIDHLYNIDFKNIINILLKLKINNGLQTGNVKVLIAFHSETKAKPVVIAYQVIHRYPTEMQYMEGIRTSLFEAEREKPNVKYIRASLQEKCSFEINKRDVYELLLVDHNGYVTEGSKSNVFLVRDGILCTPPADCVLKGITREKVIGICRESHYPLREEYIPASDLHYYTAAFITGTSPKVLPVASIDAIPFNAAYPLILQIKAHYDAWIESYKAKICRNGYSIDF